MTEMCTEMCGKKERCFKQGKATSGRGVVALAWGQRCMKFPAPVFWTVSDLRTHDPAPPRTPPDPAGGRGERLRGRREGAGAMIAPPYMINWGALPTPLMTRIIF